MLKRIMILCTCVAALLAMGCNSEDEVKTVKNGIYYAKSEKSYVRVDESQGTFLWVSEDKMEQGLPGELYSYVVENGDLVGTDTETNSMTFEIVNSETLKLDGVKYSYEEAKTDVSKVKNGYYWADTGAGICFDNDQILKYVFAGMPYVTEFSFIIDGDNLIATSSYASMNFEIVDEETLQFGEEIYYYQKSEN